MFNKAPSRANERKPQPTVQSPKRLWKAPEDTRQKEQDKTQKYSTKVATNVTTDQYNYLTYHIKSSIHKMIIYE